MNRKKTGGMYDVKALACTYQVYVDAIPLPSCLFPHPPALACHQFFFHRRACMPLQQIRRGIQGEGRAKGTAIIHSAHEQAHPPPKSHTTQKGFLGEAPMAPHPLGEELLHICLGRVTLYSSNNIVLALI